MVGPTIITTVLNNMEQQQSTWEAETYPSCLRVLEFIVITCNYLCIFVLASWDKLYDWYVNVHWLEFIWFWAENFNFVKRHVHMNSVLCLKFIAFLEILHT